MDVMTRSSLPRRAGFTVAELVISMTILGIVLAGSTIVLLQVQRQYTVQRGDAQARETVRSLELVLGRLFRAARADPTGMAGANVAMVVGPSGPPFTNVEIRSDSYTVDGTVNQETENVRVTIASDTVYVRWKKGGVLQPFAYPVSQLRFQFYDLAGTTELTTAAAAAGARRVKVTIGVPVPKSSDVLTREIWFALRN
jgi:prepilin-type N-terminal cleavage/methylation domain-containing protein